MKLEKIIPKKNERLRLSSLVYLGDAAGCGTIRAIIPSLYLNQFHNKRFEFVQMCSNVFTKDISVYKDCIWTVFQRSATKRHLELILFFKDKIQKLTRTKAIYESDDLLTEIPSWNYASEYYSKNRAYVYQMLAVVDGITVSTPKLKEMYSQFNENIVVIPNHLAKFIWKEAVPKIAENKRPRIIYPCSMNHFTLPGKGFKGGDMGPTLLKFIEDTAKEYDWHFVGGLPNELTGLVKSGVVKQHPWLSVYHYPDFLKSLNADIGIAPLEINDFNRCKSSIKQLEYAALGIPGVYTDIDPYSRALLKSPSEEEFIANIEALVKDPDLRLKVWKHDYEAVKDELFWEDNNNIIKYVNSHLSLFGKELGL